ncbi:PREDICTED: pentatricopeptide repeat-containing protein At4g30825, chloroplastic [Camelina sativa]|uniref:Pentatricopeptide repeat-containing protein At4g30825, chloroplastic n=1 Tax=Camelina sativa TaxID=90675 RepID=A0ABM0TXN8_CAMSA|nr:PREDICTED: pentatricopeptide repeat-containing protein At4g30825, chloroplastic [Camelina sativa]
MGSLRFSIPLNPFDSKRFHFSANPFQFPDQFPIFSVTSSSNNAPAARTFTIGSLIRVKKTRVSRLDVEAKETTENDIDSASEANVERSSSSKLKGVTSGNKRWTKKDVVKKFSFRRESNELEDLLVKNGEVDVNYSAIKPGLSLEHCNGILKRLESCSDSNAVKFFDWMRCNGKLQGNFSAYSLILRVLGRREDWDRAEDLIKELCGFQGFQQSFQVFNTVIYACAKKGNVKLGSKWFQLMLELGVRPNVATIGMLMGLYQKNWNVDEAEFAFSHMRNFGIVCESAYSAMITIYTRLRLYGKAEEVIDLMKKDRVRLNLENWLVMLNAYSQQGKMEQAESVLISMEAAGFAQNIIAYNTLITGYGKVSKMEAAQSLFYRFCDIGMEPDETSYRSMIEGWGRSDNYEEAKHYYQELKQLGYKPNSSNLFTLINLQAKYGDRDGAIKTIEDMVNIGCQYSSILGIILQAYEKVGKLDEVPYVLKGSFHNHIRLNQTSFSILVMAYIKHGMVDDCLALLREKKWRDSAFESHLYHLLICSCKESGQLADAVKIYNHTLESDEQINLHITSTMIDIYTVMGEFGEAEKLYSKLKSSGVVLDRIGFSIVVRMYVKAGSLEEACSVLEIMDEQKDIVPDLYLFRDMLRIYQKCGLQDKLQHLYYRIRKSGIHWDQEMYNCVINCCARALPLDELSRTFEEMIRYGFTPNTVTFNVLLDVYGKAKLFKKVNELFMLAKRHGVVDVISYNTIIAAYGQNKDFTNMSSAVKNMQFDGFSVSLEAYNSMLNAYGKDKQMEKFRSILKRMKSTCGSDHYTYNIMINIYGEQGWIDEVTEVLTELKKSGLGPDLCSYNTLIKAYGIGGMVEEAVGLVKEMRGKKITPDKVTYTNLVTALRRNDEFLEAIKWSLWMKQMGI